MLTVENTLKWLALFDQAIQTNQAQLSELDTPIGDGDHGHNMARGMTAVTEVLADKAPTEVPAILKLTAMNLISKVGGAAGPLYGTAFLEMAKKSAETLEIAPLLSVGLAGIEKRGHATVGEKTMIDVWQPVVTQLEQGSLTAEAVNAAVEATASLRATKGRASYLGERSIGHVDPGAASSGYLFTTMLEAGINHD